MTTTGLTSTPSVPGSAGRGSRRHWALRRIAAWSQLTWLRRLALLVFPVGCGLAAVAIGEDITGDTLLYHYYDAWAFLQGRLLEDVFPGYWQTLLNPLEDLPLFLLTRHTPPTFAAFMAGFWQGLSPLLAYLIARRITRSRLVALFAGTAAAVAGGFASELGSMMGDSTVAPFYLLAALLAVVALERQAVRSDGQPARWWWLASGVSLGLGTGLKFAESAVGIGLVVAVLFTSGGWRTRLWAFAASVLGSILGTLATAGYWSWFLWKHFGDPFAFTGSPFGPFTSTYFPSGPMPSAWHPPADFGQALYFPIYWFFHSTAVVGISLREASLPIAYVLVLLLALLSLVRLAASRGLPGRRGGATRRVEAGGEEPRAALTSKTGRLNAGIDRYLIATFAVSLIVWVKVFAVYRYLIPLELLSPVVIIAAGRRIATALGSLDPRLVLSNRTLFRAFAVICVLCMASESPGNYWLRIPFGSKEFSVATPIMLRNGKLNAVVLLGDDPNGAIANPDSFVLPELSGRFVAIGGILDVMTPATERLVQRAFAKVRRSGGNVVGIWISTPPMDNTQYVSALEQTTVRVASCVRESLHVGYGYEPIGFCKYVPAR